MNWFKKVFGDKSSNPIYSQIAKDGPHSATPQINITESNKVAYDEETIEIKEMLESAMNNGNLQLPNSLFAKKESCLRCLRIIIEDASADFYMRRMSVWWGSQFKDDAFNTFLKKRFVDGKDRVSLYQKTESSQSEVARAEEGLHIASVDVLSGSWKP
ncbi:MAG: hypothetical protein ACOYLO_14605 [Ferruginibacter sp.]